MQGAEILSLGSLLRPVVSMPRPLSRVNLLTIISKAENGLKGSKLIRSSKAIAVEVLPL